MLPSETSAFALADGAPLASCAAAFSADLVRLGVRVGVRLRLRVRVTPRDDGDAPLLDVDATARPAGW